MNLFNKSTNKSAQAGLWRTGGQALLELSLLLPFFLVITFGVVEYSHMFMTKLRVSNLSRASANTAFRDCGFLDSALILNCLSASAGRVRDEANLLLSDFGTQGTVMTSAYEPDSGGGSSIRLVEQQSAGSGGYLSRYGAENVNPAVVTDEGRIVIGEVVYPYTPITPLGQFLNLLNIRTVIYEVTIY